MSETQIRTGDTVRIVFYGTLNNIEGMVVGKCNAGYDIHVTIPDDDESSLCFFYSEVELVESAKVLPRPGGLVRVITMHEPEAALGGPLFRRGQVGYVMGNCDGVYCTGNYDVHVSFTSLDDDSICMSYSDLEIIETGGQVSSLTPKEAALVESARSRVDSQFRLVGYGDVGEPSNGALIVRLADLVEKLSGGAVE